MDIEKLLLEIDLDLGTFHAHLKRMRKKGKTIHLLDVELMQDKTRRIYDHLLELEKSLATGNDPGVHPINLPETMPEAAIPETVESKRKETAETITLQTEEEKPQPASAAPPEVKIKEEVTREVAEEKRTPPVTPTDSSTRPDKNIKVEPVSREEVVEEKKKSAKSTIDLFSDSAEETIADKLGTKDDPSIARKMQTQKISSLKQAIGINEKFLFINELFGGDLGNYNHAIEEFDRMQTSEGTLTHLRELKISNQWSDDNEAYLKFKVLVERKSS